MKRGIEISFTFIFIALFMIVVLLFGFFIIRGFMSSTEDLETTTFITNVKNVVNEYQGYNEGSQYVLSFSLPTEITKVCFTGDKENFDDNELKVAYNKERNMYIFPGVAYNLAGLKAKDGELCIENFGGDFSLLFTKRSDYVEVSSNDKKVECVNVVYNGDYKNKIDVVFLGYNYEDTKTFSDDANIYVDELSQMEPYLSNKNKFNFYRIDEFRDLGCRETSGMIICDDFRVNELALKCPNDQIVVLDKKNAFSLLRSTASGNIISLNTADSKSVLMHEFGHSIGGLGDEYVYVDSDVDYPNCDLQPCNKWDGNGCYSGCSSSLYYRPSETSIMKDLGDVYYNDVSLGVLNKRIGVYQ